MSTDREDGDERQTRLAGMIAEFRQAQSRRLAMANEKAVALQDESDKKAPTTATASPQNSK